MSAADDAGCVAAYLKQKVIDVFGSDPAYVKTAILLPGQLNLRTGHVANEPAVLVYFDTPREEDSSETNAITRAEQAFTPVFDSEFAMCNVQLAVGLANNARTIESDERQLCVTVQGPFAEILDMVEQNDSQLLNQVRQRMEFLGVKSDREVQ